MKDANKLLADPSTQAFRSLPTFEHIEETFDSAQDLVCFSHLRWDFVYQRPQHLMSRFAREGRVFYVEEPIFTSGEARLTMRVDDNSGVCVVTPQLPAGLSLAASERIQKQLANAMFAQCVIRNCIAWYYTPMAYAFAHELPCSVVVYDCMDELSLFKGAPPDLVEHETKLIQNADIVFTGGLSLYERKRSLHNNVHPAPSSIDVEHFRKARTVTVDPVDQAGIKRPRLGFAGVIDERMDLDLLATLSEEHPEWQFILLGPVVKIDPATLPKAENIHYLGKRLYEELPSFIGGWDVALMPFAKNDATRYISPTKTPEYLASGKPVVSTSIRDVVQTYKRQGLVRIADTPAEFADAIRRTLDEKADAGRFAKWIERADQFLANTSWEKTWSQMRKLIDNAIATRLTTHANAS
jgi:UDP-galactopyranose mutase